MQVPERGFDSLMSWLNSQHLGGVGCGYYTAAHDPVTFGDRVFNDNLNVRPTLVRMLEEGSDGLSSFWAGFRPDLVVWRIEADTSVKVVAIKCFLRF